MARQVTVYSHERCTPCRVLKRYLQERQVAYELKNVTSDETALHEFLALGGRLPPLTVIDGAVVRGFDLARLDALLDEPDDPATNQPHG